MQKIKSMIVILIFIILLNFSNFIYAEENVEEEFDFTQINDFLQIVNSEANEMPSINSRHAVIYERNTGIVLYGKKENEKCKMASTTKIMTAIIVIENVKNLEEKVEISAKSAGTGGSRLGLHKNDKITVKDLLYGLLLCSRK